MIATTILGCAVVALFICVIVLERRLREVVHYNGHSAQTIIPGTAVILASKWYNLFRIPPDLPRSGTGSICLSATGSSTECTDICIVLYGINKDPTDVYNAMAVQTFTVDEVVKFDVDLSDRGHMIAMRLDTSNPGIYLRISDIVATLIIR